MAPFQILGESLHRMMLLTPPYAPPRLRWSAVLAWVFLIALLGPVSHPLVVMALGAAGAYGFTAASRTALLAKDFWRQAGLFLEAFGMSRSAAEDFVSRLSTDRKTLRRLFIDVGLRYPVEDTKALSGSHYRFDAGQTVDDRIVTAMVLSAVVETVPGARVQRVAGERDAWHLLMPGTALDREQVDAFCRQCCGAAAARKRPARAEPAALPLTGLTESTTFELVDNLGRLQMQPVGHGLEVRIVTAEGPGMWVRHPDRRSVDKTWGHLYASSLVEGAR